MGKIVIDNNKSSSTAASEIKMKETATREKSSTVVVTSSSDTKDKVEANEEKTVTDEFVESEGMENVDADEGMEGEFGAGEFMEGEQVLDGYSPEGDINIDYGFEKDMYYEPGMEEGMYVDPAFNQGGAAMKDPLLSSWLFVIGITVAVLIVSMGLGALLARRKIKKGIELYED